MDNKLKLELSEAVKMLSTLVDQNRQFPPHLWLTALSAFIVEVCQYLGSSSQEYSEFMDVSKENGIEFLNRKK